MCGRYASTKSATDLAREFRAVDATGGNAPAPDWNVAPTKPVLAVVRRHPRDAEGTPDPSRTERSVRIMRWGLVPSWAKDPSVGSRMINARAETAAVKPAYRKALAARRCLLPADGWYEWKRGGDFGDVGDVTGGKQPYFVTRADGADGSNGADGSDRLKGASLALAGLWEFWRPRADGGTESDEAPLVTAAVLTTEAVGPLTEIHERMPLVLAPEDWDAWLDPDAAPPEALLRPPSEKLVARLELRPVSSRVNDVRHEGPGLTERVEAAEPALTLDLPAGTDAMTDPAPGAAPDSG